MATAANGAHPLGFHEMTTARLRLRPMALSDAPQIHEIRKLQSVMKWTSVAHPLQPHRGQALTRSRAAPRAETSVEESVTWLNEKIFADPSSVWNFSIELLPDNTALPAEDRPKNLVIGAVGAVRGAELGYMLNAAYHGKGYATEAVKGFLELFWAVIPRPQAVSSSIGADERVANVDAGGRITDPRVALSGPDAIEQQEGKESGGVEKKVDKPTALSLGWDHIEAIIDPENHGSRGVLQKCGFTLWRSTKDDFHSPIMGTRSTSVYRLARPGTDLGAAPGPFEV